MFVFPIVASFERQHPRGMRWFALEDRSSGRWARCVAFFGRPSTSARRRVPGSRTPDGARATVKQGLGSLDCQEVDPGPRVNRRSLAPRAEAPSGAQSFVLTLNGVVYDRARRAPAREISFRASRAWTPSRPRSRTAFTRRRRALEGRLPSLLADSRQRQIPAMAHDEKSSCAGRDDFACFVRTTDYWRLPWSVARQARRPVRRELPL